MPFTASHPAAVLPLLRIGVPASALVIGCLAPDLPYYLPTPVTAIQTHTVAGVFGADLLLGLVAFLVWHLWLVPPLVWAAPAAVQRRIPRSARGGLASRLASARDLALVAAGLVIGALTHVAWDAFTHAGMWGPRTLPWLSTPVMQLELFRWLQLASSAAGLALIAWFLLRWWRSAPLDGHVEPIRPDVRWGALVVLLGWAGWATFNLASELVLAPGRVSRESLLIATIVEFTSTLAVGLLIAAALWHVVVGRSTAADR